MLHFSRCLLLIVLSAPQYYAVQPLKDRPLTGLIPAIHWEHDASDPTHLRPQKKVSFFYQQHSTSHLSGEPFQVAHGDMDLFHPSVILDHTSHISSIKCKKVRGLDYTGKRDGRSFRMTLAFQSLKYLQEAQNMWESTLRNERILFIGTKLEAVGCARHDQEGDEEDRFYALSVDYQVETEPESLEMTIAIKMQDPHLDGLYKRFDLRWGSVNPFPNPNKKRFNSADVAAAQIKRQETGGVLANNITQIPYFVMDPKYSEPDPETGFVWNDTEKARKLNDANLEAPWNPEEKVAKEFSDGMGDWSGWVNSDGTPVNDRVPGEPLAYPPVPETVAPNTTNTDEREFYLTQFKADEGYLVGSPGGNFFIDEDDEEVTSYTEPISPRAFVYERGAIAGDYEGRLIHIYKDEIETYGVSRLRAHPDTKTPKTAVFVDLRANTGGWSFVRDTLENEYALVSCSFEDSTKPRKVFVVASLTDGIERLESREIQHIITGAAVESCEGLIFRTENMQLLEPFENA